MPWVTDAAARIHDPDARPFAATAPAFRRVEVAALAVFPFAAISLGARTWSALESPWHGLLALAAGFLFADLGSGVVHWLFDTWFEPETPWVGHAFVRTFREHHVDPTAICRHDFVETNGSNALVGCVLVASGHLALGASSAFAAATLLVVGVLTTATSQIHKWAHVERVPPVVAWLQRARVILSPPAHAAHHAAPFDRAYCITAGWSNGALERVGFFRALEGAIAIVTGAAPRRDDANRVARRS
jgi:hypothetical protein